MLRASPAMNATGVDRRFAAPPWPLVLVQVFWLWTAAALVFFAVTSGSARHIAMMFMSLFLVVGLWLDCSIGALCFG